MKYIIYGFVAICLALLSVTTILTVETKSQKEVELQQAVDLTMDELFNDIARENVSEIEARGNLSDLFCEKLKKHLQQNQNEKESKFTVEIYGEDISQGMLSVKVVEDFSYFTGKQGKCSVTSTKLIDQKEEKKLCKVNFYVDGSLWEAYEIMQGKEIPTAKEPNIAGKKFLGWKEDETKSGITSGNETDGGKTVSVETKSGITSGNETDGGKSGKIVTEDVNFVAVFQGDGV